ncbi:MULTISPECIES: hypothetical protein [unclassified Spirosoma]|uniref:hypothetical protein n=1 Tax=unclassified Spirosoma TaxID=2621999 RepID=UPI000968A9D6|nr:MULTISPECIES: hypothetical protein [unclassified Spirosoma]MBN8826485.1 hypothetical protein [Spirosoma sp.]OJW76424.1 MAG: hypothetical protein BGO59_23195 [Spirosoma sp. 48-14]
MKTYLLIALGSLMALSCKTDMITHLEVSDFENGGYMRTVTPYPVANSTFSVSKANMSGTKMEFVAEAVTANQGALFASYDLTIKFVDATPANGTITGTTVALKSIAASAFTKDATTGYPRATISVTGTEALTATKLTAADIANGDRFEINGTMKLTDGKSFSASNTSPNITGGAFYSSPFFYRLNVVN